MEGLSPELQVKPTTSGSARLIGKAIDKSPIKVEEFIKGSAGGLGMQGLNLIDRVLAGADIIPKDQIGGQGVVEAVTNRFTSARSGEKGRSQTEELYDLLKQQADERFRIKQEAELLYDQLSELPKDQANIKAKEIKKVNPELFEKLKDIKEEKKLGLTYDDRLIKQLGVANQARAKFILAKTEQMESKEEKNTYIKMLRDKKIITDEVWEQLKELTKK